MDDYQQFWNNQIVPSQQSQIVIDWDTFIHSFAQNIAKYAQYQLNQTQKQFIKAKIDPQGRNQIYKSAFLLFTKHFWDIPSNRTNLFKMKMNLTNVLPRFKLMNYQNNQLINITIRYRNDEGDIKIKKYELKQNKIYLLSNEGYSLDEKSVIQKGFVSIGSDKKNDIAIQDCIFINKHHMKLISVNGQRKNKKANIYSETATKPILFTHWFIRDTGRSNRLRYVMNTPWKYIALKPNMKLTMGLTDDYEITITKVGYKSEGLFLQKEQQTQILSLLNADRINFMGEVDPKIPLKTLLNLNYEEITSKDIEEMYKQELYYPETRPSDNSYKDNQNKETPCLCFEISNKRNLTKLQFTCFESTCKIGRSQSCTYRINQIGIRSVQWQFQCVNGVWIGKNPEADVSDNFNSNSPSVFFSSLKNIQENRNSERLQLKEGYPYVLRGKLFQFQIQLKEPISEDDSS